MFNRHFFPDRRPAPKDFWLAGLLADGSKAPRPPSITPEGAGGKFTLEGKPQFFPGNTFICHIDRATEAYRVLCDLQDRLKQLPAADHFTFLPHESFHMTVFCGLAGVPLDADGWPTDVEPGLSLETMNDRFKASLAELSGFDDVTVRVDHLKGGYSLHVEPTTREGFDALWTMRDHLRKATGLKRDNHDAYQFHISFGYRTRWMERQVAEDHLKRASKLLEEVRDDLQSIKLGATEFCRFESMHHFQTMGFIGSSGYRPAVEGR